MATTFHKKRKKYVTLEEINLRLSYCKSHRKITFNEDPENYNGHIGKINAIIEDKEKFFYLTYDDGSKVCTYIFNKGDGTIVQALDGADAWRIMNQYHKLPHRKGDIKPAGAILYFNPNHEGEWLKAYEYDLNSAFSSILIKEIPDFSQPFRSKVVEKGEIGWDYNGFLIHKGFAPFVLPLIESPYKKFVEVYYGRKEKAREKGDKIAAKKNKDVLNFCIGYSDKHNGIDPESEGYRPNPWFRNFIIYSCNEYIESLMDENTILCNTDSIVSLAPRNDLKIGTKIGEWKLEQEGYVAYKSNNYQWKGNKPKYRGIPSEWFDNDWDITKGLPPLPKNKYQFDYEKVKIVLRSK